MQPHSGSLAEPFACKTSRYRAVCASFCLQPVSMNLYTCPMSPPVSRWGELIPEQYGCSNLLELCLALPHICYVHPLPAVNQNAEQEHWVCAAVYHSLRSNHKCVVAASQEQRRTCVASKVGKVSKEPSTKEEVREGKKSCALETSVSFSELKENVAKVLQNTTDGILKSAFDSRYEEVIGQKLESRRFGFFNTNALLRSLQGNVVDLKVPSCSKEVMVFSHNE